MITDNAINLFENTEQARQAESESPPRLLMSIRLFTYEQFFKGLSIYYVHIERGRELAKKQVMVREAALILCYRL